MLPNGSIAWLLEPFLTFSTLATGASSKAFAKIATAQAPDACAIWIPRLMFTAERRFYADIQSHPDLEVFCSEYFGEADPIAIVASPPRPLAAGCSLLLEKVPGTPLKLAELDRPLQSEVEGIIELIRDAIGLDDLWDGSCFVPGTRARFTLIDLSTPTERLVCLEAALESHGHLPLAVQRALGIP